MLRHFSSRPMKVSAVIKSKTTTKLSSPETIQNSLSSFQQFFLNLHACALINQFKTFCQDHVTFTRRTTITEDEAEKGGGNYPGSPLQ